MLLRLQLAAVAAAVAASPSNTVLRDVPYVQRSVGFQGGGWVTGLALHKASGILYARTDVGGAYRSDDGGGNWTWLTGRIEAPGVWSTQGLATNQSDQSGNTVLLGVGGGVVTPYTGVYKSTDGGRTFRQTLAGVAFNGANALRHSADALVIDEARPSRVWAATAQGLWRSLDGGESFTPCTAFNSAPWFTNGSAASSSQALVSLVPPPDHGGGVDPALAAHVVVGGHTFGLAFSPDDGATWVRLAPGGGAVAASAGAVAVPSLPVPVTQPWRFHRMPNGTAFFSTEGQPGAVRPRGLRNAAPHSVEAPVSPPYVFRVEAAAGAWADPTKWAWTDITPGGEQALVGGCNLVDTPLGYDGPLIVACSYGYEFYSSSDSGASWTTLNATLSFDQPTWWWPSDPFLPWGRNKVVVSKLHPGKWILATGFGVVASFDSGHTWGQSSDGFAEVVVEGCHSHPTIPNNTFCGAQDLGGFLIGDGGASGKAAASAFAVAPVYWDVDFGKGAVVWTNITHTGPDGVPRPSFSFAGGAKHPAPGPGTWVTWSNPADPSIPASLVSIDNTSGVLAGLAELEFTDLLQSPDDPLDVLLGVCRGESWFAPWNATMPLSNYTGGVVRSRDGGASWQHVARQPPFGNAGNAWTEYRALATDGGDANARWWALAGSGLYLSRDRGETWDLTPAQPFDRTLGTNQPVAVAPDSSAAMGGPGHAYSLTPSRTGAALRHTTDFGASFSVVGNFSFPPVTSLGLDVQSAYPYLATHPSGRVALVATALDDEPLTTHVYVSLDSATSWTVVDRAEDGQYLGSGVTGLHWDAQDPTLLYVSTAGHSLVVVKMMGQ